MGGNAQGLPKRTAALLLPESDTSSSGGEANPSVRFGNAVATTSEEFGAKFGHYGRHVTVLPVTPCALLSSAVRPAACDVLFVDSHLQLAAIPTADACCMCSSQVQRGLLPSAPQAAAPEPGCWTIAIWEGPCA